MATYTCAISGLKIQCDLMSIELPASVGYFHPIFTLTQKQLLAASTRLHSYTPKESYLYFLALLHSTDSVIWKYPAACTEQSLAVVSQYTEELLHLVGKINSVRHPSFKIPRLTIYKETRNLESVSGWVHGTKEAFAEWAASYQSISISVKLARRKEALERLIKSPQKDLKSFSLVLADWASLALQFPHAPRKGSNEPVAEYWKRIIAACTSSQNIFSIPAQDLAALIDYCEANLDAEAGSIYGHALMQHLYEGRRKQQNFLGFGDADLLGSYRIISSGSSMEVAAKLAMIDSAPEQKPTREEYPNLISYLRAKARYDLKVAAQTESTGEL